MNSARIGFWSALLYAVLLVALNVSFAIMALEVSSTEWEGMDVYAQTYRDIAFVPQGIGLASIPALIMMLASIYKNANGSGKVWGLAGLSFGTAYTVLLGSLYYVQVAIVLPSLRQGHWQGLDQFAFANPNSIAWGLNHFAWSLLGIALLLMAWIFEGDRLKRWIRWLFVFNGIANLSLIFSYAFEFEALTLAIALMSWVIALPLAAVLVTLMFRQQSI